MSATTDYSIFISGSSGNMRLPVNPEEYTIRYPDDHVIYNVLDIGEVIQPRLPGLRVIEWEGYLPGNLSQPEVVSDVEPDDFIDAITGYMKKQTKVRFIASRVQESGRYIFDTNIKVVVTNFEQTERGGETGDFYYLIQLTEYKDFTAELVALIPTTTTNTVQANTTPQREASSGVISVGDTVIANGTYYYDSYGASPTGNASNLRTTVTRIVSSPQSGQRYPYHIGTRGWLTVSQLQKV